MRDFRFSFNFGVESADALAATCRRARSLPGTSTRAGLRFVSRIGHDGRWIEAHPVHTDPGGQE